MLTLQEDTMTAIAKVTSKGQITIPREVRTAMHVEPGDHLVWEVSTDGVARVRRAQPLDFDYARAVEGSLPEWSSPEDNDAYQRL
jgi:AbrB family looped-hinge helix DNA binding protein